MTRNQWIWSHPNCNKSDCASLAVCLPVELFGNPNSWTSSNSFWSYMFLYARLYLLCWIEKIHNLRLCQPKRFHLPASPNLTASSGWYNMISPCSITYFTFFLIHQASASHRWTSHLNILSSGKTNQVGIPLDCGLPIHSSCPFCFAVIVPFTISDVPTNT